MIFELLTPPTRDGVYELMKLTHVCRVWKTLIDNPQAWATIFATLRDRRSFVNMCLERSYPTSLEVAVDAHSYGRADPSCTCVRDDYECLFHNETEPCEFHFVFESLVEPKHSTRIRSLSIVFDDGATNFDEEVEILELDGCRFFELSDLKLTSLNLDDSTLPDPEDRFSLPSSLFPPTLRFLTFRRSSDHGQFMKLNNLTTFALDSNRTDVDAEGFRKFILHNQSLETLSLNLIGFEGGMNEEPATLPNLKSFSVNYESSEEPYSTIFRVPALQHLSFLSISVTKIEKDTYRSILHATGDDIAFILKCDFLCIVEVWQELTGYAKLDIQHVRLENPEDLDNPYGKVSRGVIILKIGRLVHPSPCFECVHPDFWGDPEEIGSQSGTIRFEIPTEVEECEDLGNNHFRIGPTS